jgi:peptidoglycan/LPS O-acetylase OafA/YrhL
MTSGFAGTRLSAPHVPYLDGWRGLAIACLLVGHFTPLPGLDFGRFGVELFFVLSGRLMAEILFVQNFPLPAFFRRRIARVWPALFVFVLAIAAVSPVFYPGEISGLSVLAALTFTANYVGAYGHGFDVYDHIWSLCVEEHAYVFLALVALLARRRLASPATICLFAALCAMLSGAYQSVVLHGGYHQVYWRTDARVSSILLSSAFYILLHENKSFFSRIPRITPVLFGVLAAFLSVRILPDAVKHTFGTLCLAISVCSIDRAPGFILWILRSPVMVRLGLWSFSLYLWQQVFRVQRGELTPVLLFAGAFACALVSYYLVERPARRFLNQYWGTGRLRAALLCQVEIWRRLQPRGWGERLIAWRRSGAGARKQGEA